MLAHLNTGTNKQLVMKPKINNPKNKTRLCVNDQVLTDIYTQRNTKHNQNNNRQKYTWG